MELVPYKLTERLGWASIQVETGQDDGRATKQFSPAHLAGILISELKHKAEAHLGREVGNAVIAVPIHLTYTAAREELVAAGRRKCGFWGVKAIDQQIAAAAAYQHHTKQGDGKAVLVFRLGGRTSDATIFKFINGTARYITARSDLFLGGKSRVVLIDTIIAVLLKLIGSFAVAGDDFTARIVDYMVELIRQQHRWDIRQDKKALLRLRVACEHAKKALSEREETLVQVDNGGGVSFSAPLTRAKLEELNQDLFDRAMGLLEEVVMGTGNPRVDSRKDMVDEIVLVGGSARIPKVRQLVKDYFHGREPNRLKGVEVWNQRKPSFGAQRFFPVPKRLDTSRSALTTCTGELPAISDLMSFSSTINPFLVQCTSTAVFPLCYAGFCCQSKAIYLSVCLIMPLIMISLQRHVAIHALCRFSHNPVASKFCFGFGFLHNIFPLVINQITNCTNQQKMYLYVSKYNLYHSTE